MPHGRSGTFVPSATGPVNSTISGEEAVAVIYETSVEALHADHERWVAEGRMTAGQMARIEARERRRNREDPADTGADRVDAAG